MSKKKSKKNPKQLSKRIRENARLIVVVAILGFQQSRMYLH